MGYHALEKRVSAELGALAQKEDFPSNVASDVASTIVAIKDVLHMYGERRVMVDHVYDFVMGPFHDAAPSQWDDLSRCFADHVRRVVKKNPADLVDIVSGNIVTFVGDPQNDAAGYADIGKEMYSVEGGGIDAQLPPYRCNPRKNSHSSEHNDRAL